MILAAIDSERVAILASLTAERETILAAADALQKASFTDLKTETVRSLDRIDQLSTARVQDLSRASRDAIDHMFWRALELALVVCAGLTVQALVRRRRPPTNRSALPRSHVATWGFDAARSVYGQHGEPRVRLLLTEDALVPAEELERLGLVPPIDLVDALLSAVAGGHVSNHDFDRRDARAQVRGRALDADDQVAVVVEDFTWVRERDAPELAGRGVGGDRRPHLAGLVAGLESRLRAVYGSPRRSRVALERSAHGLHRRGRRDTARCGMRSSAA